jgi:hypothetical protein
MSQHDMIIDNASGASVRGDINNALQALASTGKGNSAPPTPYAGQPWVDDNTPSGTKWTESVYDGTDWIKKGEINTTDNVYVAQVGGGTSTVASATTTDLGSVFEASVTVSGTTPITGFGSSAPKGSFKLVTFSAALLLTHNATSLKLPTSANITTAADDTLIAEHLGSGNWKVHHYTPADGRPVGGATYKTVTTTYDLATASGNKDITGFGFTAKFFDIRVFIAGQVYFCTGTYDTVTQTYLSSNAGGTAGTFTGGTGNCFAIQVSGVAAVAGVASVISDGIRIAMTKAGSPTGTVTIVVTANR